jgi:hypothetical protein
MLNTRSTRWLTRQAQARRWGVPLRVVEDWGRNESIGLPAEFEVDGRFFRLEEAIERWERGRLVGSVIRNLLQEPATSRAT